MEAPSWMFTKALSHRQKVLRLYKKASRMIEWYHFENSPGELLNVRFHQVLLRHRFDMNKDVKDPRKSSQLLIDGCRELWEKRTDVTPLKASIDPYGIGWNREANITDWESDTTLYVEREQFPYYFNRREQRKREFVAHWEKIQTAWDAELASIQRKPPPE